MSEQPLAVVGAARFAHGVDSFFPHSVSALPDVVAAADEHGIVETFARAHLVPMCVHCSEHLPCEFTRWRCLANWTNKKTTPPHLRPHWP